MLPRGERKALAKKYGYNNIGEFEEYMSLQQAVDDSGTKPQQAYDNELIYAKETETEAIAAPRLKKKESDDSFDDEESSVAEEQEYNRQLTSGIEDLSLIIKMGGKLLILHDELLHNVFSYLPVENYGTLALVSPHWKHLTRTEAVYRRLCERLYLQQSKRKQLHLSRFGGKYRTMLEQRPRVLAAGGCYVLKYSHIKKIERDMWSTVSDDRN
jgi:F-box protein 9